MLREGGVPGRVLGRLGAGGFMREYPKIWVNKNNKNFQGS